MLELFSREPWERGTSCKADVHGGCTGSPRELHERSAGCRGLPSSLPKLQRGRSLLAVQSTHSSQLCRRQTDAREDVLTHQSEVGAAKPCGVLPMDSTRKMYFMQHGVSRPALTRNSTFKREEYIWGRVVRKKENHQLPRSATQYLFYCCTWVPTQCKSLRASAECISTLCSTALYEADVLLLLPTLIRKESQQLK